MKKPNKKSIQLDKKLSKKKKVNLFLKEFLQFLKEYSILGVAVGLVIGAAVNSLVQSIVTGLITPMIQLLLPSGFLKTLVYTYNGVTFQFGPVIDAFLNFLIIAFLFFFFAKVFFRQQSVSKDIFK